jgi:hypothetical protein
VQYTVAIATSLKSTVCSAASNRKHYSTCSGVLLYASVYAVQWCIMHERSVYRGISTQCDTVLEYYAAAIRTVAGFLHAGSVKVIVRADNGHEQVFIVATGFTLQLLNE